MPLSTDEIRRRQAEGGRTGNLRRWGPARVIRLGDLPPAQREFIADLVETARRNLTNTTGDVEKS